MEFVQPIRDRGKIASIKRILKAESLRNYLLFTLGINSGLRVSDLLSLRMGDILGADGKPRDRIVVREKKTGKTKDFPIGDTSKRAILEYIADRSFTLGDPVFPSQKGGKAISRVQAYRIIKEAARSVGITDKIGTHTLRKTFGYHAYKMGMDLSVIQKLLNHASPGTTLAYIGITQEELDKVYLYLEL